MQSIMQHEKACYFTQRKDHLQKHHIFFGPNRKISEHYGLTVWLTLEMHTGSNKAVHNCRETDLILKRAGQKEWERRFGSREDFIKIFGRNYLD